MIVELKLNENKMERVRVTKDNGKFFVSFVDRKDATPFEVNFEECGEFYSIIIENKPYLVKFVEEGNLYTVTSGIYTAKLSAEDQAKRIRRDVRETFSVKVNIMETRIPGKILDVMVKPGQTVKKGDELFILEAMKMENRVFAPRDGVVKDVLVKKDDVLSIGNKLLSFEDLN
ncbi:MAG: biotin/lipoyl-containing protein [Pseudomonadota bacterium]